MPIRTFALAALAASFATASALPAAAQMSQAQAKKECQAQYANVATVRAGERGGPTVAQQVAACVKQKMGSKKQ